MVFAFRFCYARQKSSTCCNVDEVKTALINFALPTLFIGVKSFHIIIAQHFFAFDSGSTTSSNQKTARVEKKILVK
jgi:hypothetical protein